MALIRWRTRQQAHATTVSKSTLGFVPYQQVHVLAAERQQPSPHPEWLMVPLAYMDGGPAKVDGKYVLDPGSPDVQEYLISIVRELVTNYAIDGINYDYIRYTVTDAGEPADLDYTVRPRALRH